MYPFSENLLPSDKNRLASYLPVRNKGNDFDWDVITGMVLGYALQKEVVEYDLEKFREDCKAEFQILLDQPEFWCVLDRIYFSSGAVFDVSPLFLLFKAQHKRSGKADLGAPNVRMAELFLNLINNAGPIEEMRHNLNFIELEMLNVFQQNLADSRKHEIKEQQYLPYIAKAFQEDILFLSTHPKYLLRELTNMLRLYAFAYCSQLALNVAGWRDSEPASKPLYFILDMEKASNERISVQHFGYKLLSNASTRLFPMLSALEVLQRMDEKRPLWKIFDDAAAFPDQAVVVRSLEKYISAFVKNRWPERPNIDAKIDCATVELAFERLLRLAIDQFRDKETTRGEINEKYTKELDKKIFGNFTQSRGRAGRVLVLNQDQLLLLTNLAIGTNEKLRLHELINEFQRRGFYFDGQSQQALVGFFERMGNVEKMSDSGDAVYVRKTV